MDNQNMTYPELRDLFVERNKTQLAKPVSACIVFADSNWPDHHYPLRSRTYEVSSDNKAFRSSCCSTSLFGSCLDGTDQICMAPFLTGKKPGIHDDGCTDYCPKPLDGCELVRSYSEHELRSYEEDVREYISQFTDEELMEAYELDRTTLNALAPRAAVLMRKYIDNDDSWTYHRDYAISEVVSEYKEDKDNG